MAGATEQDHARRFSGISRLYGEEGLSRFQQSHVAVVGVGGVGSWTVESLARSGVGTLTLIDLDHLAESNVNRQLPALDSTLGQAKVQALKARIAEINSRCTVHCIEEFISADNPRELLSGVLEHPRSLVLDCIDHARTKAALIAWCRRQKLAVLTVGGAGGRTDPLRIRVSDLSRTEEDSLLSRTRKHLRADHGYSRNPRRRFGVPAVFSDEKRRGVNADSCSVEGSVSGLTCAGYGSATHVTATMGLVAAGRALDILNAP